MNQCHAPDRKQSLCLTLLVLAPAFRQHCARMWNNASNRQSRLWGDGEPLLHSQDNREQLAGHRFRAIISDNPRLQASSRTHRLFNFFQLLFGSEPRLQAMQLVNHFALDTGKFQRRSSRIEHATGEPNLSSNDAAVREPIPVMELKASQSIRLGFSSKLLFLSAKNNMSSWTFPYSSLCAKVMLYDDFQI